MKSNQVRSFIKHKETGQIGVVIANDSAGGVFRGHADCWFGEVDASGVPIVRQKLVAEYEEIEAPLGI